MPFPTFWEPSSFVPHSGDAYIDALVWGRKWGGGLGTEATITYSFPQFGSVWSAAYAFTGEPRFGFRGLTDNQALAAEKALGAWENVANIHFVEVADTPDFVGNIRVAFSRAVGGRAHAYLPASSPKSGDIWLHANTFFASTLAGSFQFFTLLHEIGHALGLKHSFHDGAVLPAALDHWQNTVMSYSAYPGAPVGKSWAYQPTTPMRFDIKAIQYLYGANNSYHAGDDLYVYEAGRNYFETIWDAGGNDTIQYDAVADRAEIDLRPGALSNLGNRLHTVDFSQATDYTVVIYDSVVIENATGGGGHDLIYGNDAANLLRGRDGHDELQGQAGDDRLEGGAGNDTLSGGAGTDTAIYTAPASQYSVLSISDGTLLVGHTGLGTDGIDRLAGIEELEFADGLMASSQASSIYGYIASYADLIAALGASETAGLHHYLRHGCAEGRVATFDAMGYIASYADLIEAFGSDASAGARHYVAQGFAEGRSTSFAGLEYIASYADLIQALGMNADAGAAHFIDHGLAEGRAMTFNAAQYLANYADVQAAFGSDFQAATEHYIRHGFSEGRTDEALG